MHTYLQTIKVLILATVFSIGLSVASAWTEPLGIPPTNNVYAPVNISGDGQIKQGGLLLGDAAGVINGLLVAHGNVGIGTTAPSGVFDVHAGGVPYEKAGASCNAGDTLVSYKTTPVTCTGDSGPRMCPGSSCTTGSHESQDQTLETCSYQNGDYFGQETCGLRAEVRTCTATLSVKCLTARKSMFSVATSGMVSASNITTGNVTAQTINSTGLASLASLKVSGKINASSGQIIYSCPTVTESKSDLRRVVVTTCVGQLTQNPTCIYRDSSSDFDNPIYMETTTYDCTATGRMVGL